MSGEMNGWLAGLYQTGMSEQEKTAAAEEKNKLEMLELFAKVAADNNVDLSQYTPEQIVELYNGTMAKTAGEGGFPFPPKKDDEKEEKEDKAKDEDKKDDDESDKEAAAQVHIQQQADFQEKLAEADLMGRVMAHSLTQELDLIKQAQAAEAEKTASAPAPAAAPAPQVDEKTAAAHAFEELAARKAIEMAKEAGLDEAQVTNLVSARYTLGLEGTEKTAGVSDLQQALQIRGLEYLEAVGVQVNWDQLGK